MLNPYTGFMLGFIVFFWQQHQLVGMSTDLKRNVHIKKNPPKQSQKYKNKPYVYHDFFKTEMVYFASSMIFYFLFISLEVDL